MNDFNLFVTRDAYVALKKFITEEGDWLVLCNFDVKEHTVSNVDLVTLGFQTTDDGEVDSFELRFTNHGFTGFEVVGNRYSTQILYEKIKGDDDPKRMDFSKLMSQIDERVYVLNELCSMPEGNRNFFATVMTMWDLPNFNEIKPIGELE